MSRRATGIGLGLLGLWVAALPLLPPYRSGHDVLVPPGPGHLLGTNAIGQDVLAGLLRATPVTISLSLAAALIATLLALAAAGLAAVAGPLARGAILRLVDAWQALPSILVLLFVAALAQPGFIGLTLFLGLTSWPEDVRVVLASVQRELTRENVHFARRLGVSWPRCLRRHVLPAIRPMLVALYLQNVRQAVMRGASLAFLGLVDPRLPTWGGMMGDAIDYLRTPAWTWLLLPPAVLLTLLLLGLLALGERLRPGGVRA